MLVPELIQQDLNTENLAHHLSTISLEGPTRNEMLKGYAELADRLGGEGASDRVAAAMVQYLTTN
jgi:lipid-A-disaccharide synthase